MSYPLNMNSGVILASASPRRAQILEMMGIPFSVEVPDIDESLEEGLIPEEQVTEIARRKAWRVAAALPNVDKPIIACDTMVLLRNEALGKPKDREQAAAMLSALSGKVHRVLSGVCIIDAIGERSFCESTEVEFKSLSPEEIENYVDSSEPYDKAGAYGIQGPAGAFVKSIRGDYYNVVGLPLCHLIAELRGESL